MILDQRQNLIADKLQKLSEEIIKDSEKGFFKGVFSRGGDVQSLYIYGDVGRGKSMLVKKFFDCLVGVEKVYFHFNDFMNLIHKNLKEIRDENKKYDDELIEAVSRVVAGNKVICFDEFQVVDIADAMLLSRVFSYVFSKEIIVVFTSNTKPENLYKNGLQREVFLKFIDEILLKRCEILHLNSEIDYRQNFCQNLQKKYFIAGDGGDKEFSNVVAELTKGKKLESREIKIWGRKIEIKKSFNQIALVDFTEICCQNYAASDYQAICKEFGLILLENLPILTPEDVNEARRFVLFIDEIYENKVALIILAQSEIDEIYKKGIGVEAFKRTISRLKEISSAEYWNASKFVS